MAKAWDTAVIKADSRHPDAGRAGVVQSVDDKGVLTIRLDETPAGDRVKVVNANPEDVTVHCVV
ncbi:hypothetical protein [Paraburkholderia kururiensis]|uniref:hypothetical protein n=1 Tax=Paraburkholderia kururiensis TaxID=984307 RepID=UPI0005A6F6E8|nr:hypothetical protein [Paraburkholderia kururiensis]